MTRISFVSIAVMFLWSVCYPLIALSLSSAPIMLTAFLRAVISGAVLLIIAYLLKRPFPRKTGEWVTITLVGFTATSIGFWGMFYAGSLLSPGLATVITNTQPLIASLLGWFFLKERPNNIALVGIGLGFIGIFVISSEAFTISSLDRTQGILFVLTAAIAIAISNILLKRIANKTDIYYAMGLQLSIGAIPLGMFSFYQGNMQSLQLTPDYIVILFTLALLGTALPFILWFWLLQLSPLYKLNVFSFLSPVFGLLIGYVYFSELLSVIQWLGILITGIAIVMVTSADSSIRKVNSLN